MAGISTRLIPLLWQNASQCVEINSPSAWNTLQSVFTLPLTKYKSPFQRLIVKCNLMSDIEKALLNHQFFTSLNPLSNNLGMYKNVCSNGSSLCCPYERCVVNQIRSYHSHPLAQQFTVSNCREFMTSAVRNIDDVLKCPDKCGPLDNIKNRKKLYKLKKKEEPEKPSGLLVCTRKGCKKEKPKEDPCNECE